MGKITHGDKEELDLKAQVYVRYPAQVERSEHGRLDRFELSLNRHDFFFEHALDPRKDGMSCNQSGIPIGTLATPETTLESMDTKPGQGVCLANVARLLEAIVVRPLIGEVETYYPTVWADPTEENPAHALIISTNSDGVRNPKTGKGSNKAHKREEFYLEMLSRFTIVISASAA